MIYHLARALAVRVRYIEAHPNSYEACGMGSLDDTRSKKVTITIPNVPQGLWHDFQNRALRDNQSVASLLVSLMAGALSQGAAETAPEPE
jgi:hypothetical protein